jgi:hypothetical protein
MVQTAKGGFKTIYMVEARDFFITVGVLFAAALFLIVRSCTL